MSAIKDGRLAITLDKERYVLFSLNVLDEMQDKFGGYENLVEALRGKDVFKNIKWLLTRLINEGADEGEEPVTEAQVGKLVHARNLNDIINAILTAFRFGVSGAEDAESPDDEDDEKNRMSGQRQ